MPYALAPEPSRQTEAPIDPELPICDPHHHLWHRPDDRYLLEEFVADLSGGHNVRQTVYVECGSMYSAIAGNEAFRCVGETEFAQGIAAQSDSGQYGPARVAAGIVAYANLMDSNADEVIQDHFAASDYRFHGIRFSCAWDDSLAITARPGNFAGMMRDERFRFGFDGLHLVDLSFDALVYHTQLPELAELARVSPETSIILNHIGRPLGIGPYANRRDEVFAHWQDGIREVAACPNVLVKIGGFGNPISGYDWHRRDVPPTSAEVADTIAPWVDFCIKQFGPQRCMFESNFPVDKVSYPYATIWNAFQRLAAAYTADEKAAMFHDTARRAYKLDAIHRYSR